MPRSAIVRILARLKNARRTHQAHHLCWRRPSFHRTKAPGGSNGTDGRVVRQIFEVTGFAFLSSVHGVSTPLRIPPMWPVRVIIIKPNAITAKYAMRGDRPFVRSRERTQVRKKISKAEVSAQIICSR